MNGSKVQHVYVLTGHIHGFAVKGENVSYPGHQSPTRIGCRLQRTGRGPREVALQLGAKDGGTAKKADDVKFYELPPVVDSDKYSLRIIHRTHIIDVCNPLPNPQPPLPPPTYPLTMLLVCDI